MTLDFSRPACSIHFCIPIMKDLIKSLAGSTFPCLFLRFCRTISWVRYKDESFLECKFLLINQIEVEFLKKEKNYEIRTGVSGVSGGSLCNRQACPRLA